MGGKKRCDSKFHILGPLQYESKFYEMLMLGKKLAIENGGARKTKLRVAVHKKQDQNITEKHPRSEEHHCDVVTDLLKAYVTIHRSRFFIFTMRA